MQDVSLLPSFEWAEIPEAVAYEFQLSADSEFDALLVNIGIDTTSYTLVIELAYETKYYWRARAVSGNGTKSTWCVSDFRTWPESISPTDAPWPPDQSTNPVFPTGTIPFTDLPSPQPTDSTQPPYSPPTTSSPPPWPFDPPQPTDSTQPPDLPPTSSLPSPQPIDSTQPPDLLTTPAYPTVPLGTGLVPFPQVTDSAYPPNQGYILKVNISGSGEASGEGVYAAGIKVDIVATPESDEWYFDRWTGDISMVDDPYEMHTNITVNDNCTITANFKREGQSGFPVWIIGAIVGGIALISIAGYLEYRHFNKRIK